MRRIRESTGFTESTIFRKKLFYKMIFMQYYFFSRILLTDRPFTSYVSMEYIIIDCSLTPHGLVKGTEADICLPDTPEKHILENVKKLVPLLTDNGHDSIWAAVRNRGDPGIVPKLIECGLQLKKTSDIICQCVYWNQWKMGPVFSRYGVDVNQMFHGGLEDSALSCAVKKGNLEAVQFIVSTVNSRGEEIKDLQHSFGLAAHYHQTKILEYLKENTNAKVDGTDQYGKKPVTYLRESQVEGMTIYARNDYNDIAFLLELI
jgi:hypothetical protein